MMKTGSTWEHSKVIVSFIGLLDLFKQHVEPYMPQVPSDVDLEAAIIGQVLTVLQPENTMEFRIDRMMAHACLPMDIQNYYLELLTEMVYSTINQVDFGYGYQLHGAELFHNFELLIEVRTEIEHYGYSIPV